jgi:putative endonuclease
MPKQPCVYILASRRSGTIYVGVTSGLLARIHQHRTGTFRGFTSKYDVHRLVHLEMFDDIYAAISREKQLKSWRRAWKVALIEESNPSGRTEPWSWASTHRPRIRPLKGHPGL